MTKTAKTGKNPIPQRTDEQRIEALQKGIALRQERKELRQKLETDELTIEDIIQNPSEAAQGMPVRLMLTALWAVKEKKADNVMKEIGISPRRRVRGLGTRQQLDLIEWDRNRKCRKDPKLK